MSRISFSEPLYFSEARKVVKVDTRTGKLAEPSAPKADPTEKGTTDTTNKKIDPEMTQPIPSVYKELTTPLDPAVEIAKKAEADKAKAYSVTASEIPATASSTATASTPPPKTAPMPSGKTPPETVVKPVSGEGSTTPPAPSGTAAAPAKAKPAYKIPSVGQGAKLKGEKAAGAKGTKGNVKGKAASTSTKEEPFTRDDFDYDVLIQASKYGLDPVDLANRGYKPHKVIANLKGMERQRNVEKLGLTRDELRIQKSKDRNVAKVQKGKEKEQKEILGGIKRDAASFDRKIKSSAKLKPKQETEVWVGKERKEGKPLPGAEAERRAFKDYTTGPAADYDTRAAARKKVIDQNTSLRAAKQKQAAKNKKASEKEAEKNKQAEFDRVVGAEKNRIKSLIDKSKAQERALKHERKAKIRRRQISRNVSGIFGNIFGRTITSAGRLSKAMTQKPAAHF